MRRVFLMVVLAVVAICNCAFAATLKVKILNVGQGDAILIQSESQNVLVDTSDVDERAKLQTELYKAGAFTLDKIILTHPHADHIGNAAWLIKDGVFSVRAVYDNGKASTSKLYQSYLTECLNRGVPRYTAHTGDVIDCGSGATFTVLAVNEGFKNVNNDSIVGRLDFGGFSMIMSGDAEAVVEDLLLEGGADVGAVALKAGHHGSKTSNTLAFVKAVAPDYVFISAGEPTTRRGGNTYGHPHAAALENFLMSGVAAENIFWTWKNGTITVTTDGEAVEVEPELVDVWVNEYLGYRLVVTRVA